MPKDPISLVSEKQCNDVTFIARVNKNEGALFAASKKIQKNANILSI